MTNLIIAIKRVLGEEISIFKQLYMLEEDKSKAIIKKDGKALESISSSQEKFIKAIELLELNRISIIEEYKPILWPDVTSKDISLKNLSCVDENSSNCILEKGKELKKIIQMMKSLQETNQRMIKDNLEFFNISLLELKQSIILKNGYDEKGIEKTCIEDPLLFNQII
ncbi:MAG: flagellar protein FlgN [Spirochaetota bacterium]|nr:flagellar protein FlgN [Spirochaetota bacterium]